MNTYGKLSSRDATMLEYIVGDAVRLTIRNREELEAIAERFHHGDLSDAFQECLTRGIDQMMTMCEMDEKVSE